MKFILSLIIIFSFIQPSIASNKHKNKKPVAKLNLSTNKCSSPCTVTLDGSKSKAAKGKTISKYIFELGNGETIESETPSVEFTYINFKEETDEKKRKNRKEKYKKWDKYIKHCHKRFKKFDQFKVKLSVVQSDGKKSKKKKKLLFVKATDQLPTIDGDDLIPPMPNKEENDLTLLGIDIDNDGVRDDVELMLNSLVSNSDIRKPIKNLARVMNERLAIADSSNIEMIKSKLRSDVKITTCFSRKMIEADDLNNNYYKILAKSQYNTLERMKAYAKLESHSKGFTSPDYDPNPCNE